MTMNVAKSQGKCDTPSKPHLPQLPALTRKALHGLSILLKIARAAVLRQGLSPRH